MSQSTRTLTNWALLVLLLLTPTLHADEVKADPLALQVANAYGLEHWDEVMILRYTFNTQKGDKTNARTWTWWPKEKQVTLEIEGEEPITYCRDKLDDDSPEDLRKIDHRFINDSYWLLYPFQLVWSNPAITDEGMTELPIGDGDARKLITQYPDEGGYTPGDAYDLYLGDDGLIAQWVFRKGGGEKGGPMTWENNVDLGPIKVCTDHHNADKSFRLWFSDLSLTTTDGATHEPE